MNIWTLLPTERPYKSTRHQLWSNSIGQRHGRYFRFDGFGIIVFIAVSICLTFGWNILLHLLKGI